MLDTTLRNWKIPLHEVHELDSGAVPMNEECDCSCTFYCCSAESISAQPDYGLKSLGSQKSYQDLRKLSRPYWHILQDEVGDQLDRTC